MISGGSGSPGKDGRNVKPGEKAAWRRGEVWCLVLIAVGCFLRLFRLGTSPGGVNPDEALAGYEAFCLLRDGMDSWGVVRPVYLTAWGSGMNVLLSVLAMPFVAILGLCPLAVRLPQALIGCLSLGGFYGIFRQGLDRKTACIAAAFLSICPWHVLSSRYAVESGLLPGFLIFGLFFLLRGRDMRGAWLLSAVFFGLSLYTYAIVWPVLPLLLLLEAAVLIRGGRWTAWKAQLPGFAGILALFALPLLLFLLVNHGVLPELRLGFLTIPRLPEVRSDEFALSQVLGHLHVMARMLILQTDGENLFASPVAGTMYRTSLLFFCIGACSSALQFVRTLRRGKLEGGAVLFPFLLCGLVLGCLVEGNHSRLNLLHLAQAMMIPLGMVTLIRAVNRKVVLAGIAAVYLVQAGLFSVNLFTDLAALRSFTVRAGLEEGLKLAKEKAQGEEIGVTGGISYAQILFYDRTDPARFRADVVRDAEGKYRGVRAFCGFRFGGEAGKCRVILGDFETELENPELERVELETVRVWAPKAPEDPD